MTEPANTLIKTSLNPEKTLDPQNTIIKTLKNLQQTRKKQYSFR
jgi:hypothetical protein